MSNIIPCPEVARSITTEGRTSIQRCKEFMDRYPSIFEVYDQPEARGLSFNIDRERELPRSLQNIETEIMHREIVKSDILSLPKYMLQISTTPIKERSLQETIKAAFDTSETMEEVD